jgi:hypothetical protein
MSESSKKTIIIEGITAQGTKFRPSDWAERMSGSLASFSNSRIRYSHLLQPSVDSNGCACVLVDPELKETNPKLYESVLEFARTNKLRICGEEENTDA